ncbi:MAG: DUF1329 domain-containing protein, partial [Alloalcanivorax xenomutans]
MFNRKILFTAVAALTMYATHGVADTSAEDVKRLQKDLTPVGAERAGNADGSIPAWTGGLTEAPSGWTRGDDRPDPFANEDPLFTITQDNVDQYADRLTPGSIALLKRYPEFSMPVYKTHRTAAWPKPVYDSIADHATTAKLVGDGNGVDGVWGAIPFPIPENGNEVIWNHNLRFQGTLLSLPSAFITVVYNNDQRLEW